MDDRFLAVVALEAVKEGAGIVGAGTLDCMLAERLLL